MNNLKLAFFGTPDLCIPILDELERNGLAPKVIITGPDVPKGRKLIIEKPAPKVWAETRGIPVLQPEKINKEFLAALGSFEIDLGVVVAYGKIFPQSLLDLPRLGMINVHYSLLPKYRGATPVESAILHGETETGVVIQKMARAMDAGDVIDSQTVTIGEKETAPQLRTRLNEIAKKMLPDTIQKLQDGTATFQKQNEEQATFCTKTKKEDGLIDPAGDAVMNFRKFRAHDGWPGTFFFAQSGDKKIRVLVESADFQDGTFIIKRVVPEGKKEMDYSAFQNGLKK